MLPVEVDGRRLVILRQNRSRFNEVASGWLSYDGDSLVLELEDGERIITESELAGFQPIIATNRIPQCRGFDFFLLIP
jgi:hypothetical protein